MFFKLAITGAIIAITAIGGIKFFDEVLNEPPYWLQLICVSMLLGGGAMLFVCGLISIWT